MIYKNLGLSLDNPEIISVVGAGGKTSLINGLAKELRTLNKKVLSTTSTQIIKPNNIDNFFLRDIPKDFIPGNGTITSYGDHIKDGKLIGNMEETNRLINRKIFDYILIEADGANRKPLKAPASHEPVITELTTITIAVIGLDSIGQALNQSNFHRPKLIAELIEKDLEQELDSEDIVKLVLAKHGTFKTSLGRKVLILNKANSNTRIREGNKIRVRLHNENITVLISDIISKEFY